MPGERDHNRWNEYEKLVLAKLEGLELGQEKLSCDIRMMEKEIVALKIKAGLWGLIAGAVAGGGPALIAFIMWMISR